MSLILIWLRCFHQINLMCGCCLLSNWITQLAVQVSWRTIQCSNDVSLAIITQEPQISGVVIPVDHNGANFVMISIQCMTHTSFVYQDDAWRVCTDVATTRDQRRPIDQSPSGLSDLWWQCARALNAEWASSLCQHHHTGNAISSFQNNSRLSRK